MKKLNISMLILAMAVSACQEEDLQPLYDNEMHFELLAPGAQTKVTESGFELTDEVGVYVTDWVNANTPMPLQISGNRVNNLCLSYQGASWKSSKAIYWGTGKSDVYAYYPYMDEISDVNAQPFSVALDQNKREDKGRDAYEGSDFLWAKTEGVSQKDGKVKLAMKHVMSKLTVKIVAGEDYVGELPEDASVLLHSTVATARIDLETGAVVKDPYAGAQSIKMKKLGVKTSGGVEAVVYEAVVVPQMLETPVPLLEINSKSVSYLLEDSFNFRPSVAYTYTVTLNTSTNAIQVEIGCELEDWNSTGDDEEDGEDSGNEEDDEEDGIAYKSLSDEGTANCYIVSEAGDYKFKAVQGNLDATVGNVKSVDVLWESFGTETAPQIGELIASASYKNGYVRFSTPVDFKEGNALIAARNSAGVILWSWHIWFTDEPETHVYRTQSGLMMDRNLGATSADAGEVTSLGLLYQWGRKDPFLGSASISESVDAASTGKWEYDGKADGMKNMVDAAESNPTTFYSSAGGTWTLEKSASDPCPVGWRVPRGGESGIWANADFVRMPFDLDTRGMTFNITSPGSTWYPASGCRYHENGKLMYVGNAGFYSSIAGANGGAKSMFFSFDQYNDGSSDWWYNNLGGYITSAAYSVRCCREYDESLVPDNPVPEFSTSEATDLSSKSTANCYIVSTSGVYSIAAVMGNTTKKLDSAAGASVVWESYGTDEKPSKGDLISAVKYEKGNIYFKTVDAFKEGNALIAVMDANGKILWSWHIWLTDEPKGQEYYNEAGIMMDRNLGAVTSVPGEAGAMGLIYQWGRKDPFMGRLTSDADGYAESSYLWPTAIWPDSEKGTIEYSISHPTIAYEWGNYGDWLYNDSGRLDNTRWQSVKTVYDPCPAGWRVPDGAKESVWFKALGQTQMGVGEKLNLSGYLGDDKTIYYPTQGCDTDMNYNSYYWTCTPHSNSKEQHGVNAVRFDWYYISLDDYPLRAERHYVRCQKE